MKARNKVSYVENLLDPYVAINEDKLVIEILGSGCQLCDFLNYFDR